MAVVVVVTGGAIAVVVVVTGGAVAVVVVVVEDGSPQLPKISPNAIIMIRGSNIVFFMFPYLLSGKYRVRRANYDVI